MAKHHGWRRFVTDRYRTAAAVAAAYPTADITYVTSGQNWPDALAGAALAGHEEMPMLLVRKDSVPGATWSLLERLEPGRVPVRCGAVQGMRRGHGIPWGRAEESS